MEKKKFTKETLRRAWRTFWQAFVPYVAANLCVVDYSQPKDVIYSALFGLGVSAAAAGLAAIMNLEKVTVE
jgi:predicted naringenin-chalcone synthase